MKNFFAEFKKFITRGNVVDMAVGVLVGSSFTAIVNGLSNFILKPIINYVLALIFGANSLSELFTFLKKVEVADEATGEMVTDLTQSIYIDWGSFINAVINFFLIALVLFTIVKLINKLRDERKEFNEKLSGKKLTKDQKCRPLPPRVKYGVESRYVLGAHKLVSKRLVPLGEICRGLHLTVSGLGHSPQISLSL